jgi:enediyne biosynthesis protein E4
MTQQKTHRGDSSLSSGARAAVALLTFAMAIPDAASMGPPMPFTEEALERGVNYFTPFAPGAGKGLALVDLDNDGDPDLVALGKSGGRIGIYENDGSGCFIDHSLTSGLPTYAAAAGMNAFDYDADGDLDLHVARWALANVLLRNDGDFTFADVTISAGVGDPGKGTGCSAIDFDDDGWLDLYVSNMTPGTPYRNLLYRNQCDGTFEDVAPALGVDFDSYTWQTVFFDYDRDGDSDMYVSNDKGAANCDWNNYLWKDIGTAFVDVTEPSGAGLCMDSMGVAVGDLDGNGWLDLYCTNTPAGNRLLLNQGDSTFIDGTDAADVAAPLTGWAAVFFDYDNDGWLDLYVCNQSAPNQLYEYDGAWPCHEVAQALGVNMLGSSYCAATADIDDDGDLDLLVQVDNDRLRLYINHEGERRRWVKFRVLGESPNRFAIGANVDVRVGQTWRQREIFSGTNYKSQNDLTAHIGLGDAPIIDEIKVTWPGGATRTLTNMPVTFTWTLYPPSMLGDANIDGACKLADFIQLAFCFTGSGPGNLTPGCEVMDFDGDGDVDMDDYDAFLVVYIGPLDDCDVNDNIDLTEIITGASPDQNNNGVPDHCDADLNDDGSVNIDDLFTVISQWGQCGKPAACTADFDGSAEVDIDDLFFIIASWS